MELVPACIQGGVCQHRDAGELELVQSAWAGIIAPPAALIRRSSKVLVKQKFVPRIVIRGDCRIRTYQAAHSATGAVTFNVINLADPVGYLSYSTGHQGPGFRVHKAPGKDSRLNSLLRAHSSTTAAAGTTVFPPLYNVREVLQRQLSIVV